MDKIINSNNINKLCMNFDYRFQYVIVKEIQVIALISLVYTSISNTLITKLLIK